MATDGKGQTDNLIVGGYEFMSEMDAQKAAMDLSKIKLLKAKARAEKPAEIKAVYEKAIENKIFKTPIGWGYLTGLRDKLLNSGYSEDDLIPIPLNVSMTRHSALENLSNSKRTKPEKEKTDTGFKTVFSIVLNVVLLILIIVMFIITLNSDSDNILTYKSNITNRYSSWEQDLQEREKAVREAEKRLGIESGEGYYDGTE